MRKMFRLLLTMLLLAVLALSPAMTAGASQAADEAEHDAATDATDNAGAGDAHAEAVWNDENFWDDEAWWESQPGGLVLAGYGPDGGAGLVQYWTEPPTGDVVVPSEVNGHAVIGIACDAFSSPDFTSLTIPEGVLRIGEGAIWNAYMLERVYLPNSLLVIGPRAFAHCNQLRVMEIPRNVRWIGEDAMNNTALTSVTLPDNVENLGRQAFKECEVLTSVTLPAKLAYMPDRLFEGCGLLTDVYIPDGLIRVGAYAFAGCASLAALELPASVTRIGRGAFAGCDALTLHVPADSFAAQFAQESGTRFEQVAQAAGRRQRVRVLGTVMQVPDDWAVVEETNPTTGALGLSFRYPAEAEGLDEQAITTLWLNEGLPEGDARYSIALTSIESFADAALQLAEPLFGMSDPALVTGYGFWSDGEPIKGGLVSGTIEGKPWICVLGIFSSVFHSQVTMIYKAPVHNAPDTAWFTDVLEARYPELGALWARPESDAPDVADAPEATPAPTPPPPVVTDFTPEQVAAFDPAVLGGFFADAPEDTYLRLGEVYGLPLVPVTEWAKAHGLTEPTVAKGVLTFTVAKGRGDAWGGAKKVSAAVPAEEWVSQKNQRATLAGLTFIAAALAEAYTPPEGDAPQAMPPTDWGAMCAQDAGRAYLQLAQEYGIPLFPVLEWTKAYGLDAPTVAKDGALSFPVPQKRRAEWAGEKKVDAPVAEEAWLNRKGLRVSMDGLRSVLATLAAAYTVPETQPETGGAQAHAEVPVLATREQIARDIPNYAWTQTSTTVSLGEDGQSPTTEKYYRTEWKFEDGLFTTYESVGEYSGFGGTYVRYDEDGYYDLTGDANDAGVYPVTRRSLSAEDRTRYQQQHELADESVYPMRYITPDKFIVLARNAPVAGRSTTHYQSTALDSLGYGWEIWVDDALGIVLKSFSLNMRYGNMHISETTSLTLGGVTAENILDGKQIQVGRDEREDAGIERGPTGAELILSEAEETALYPYYHMEVIRGSRTWLADGVYSPNLSMYASTKHRSEGGTYLLEVGSSSPHEGYLQYWTAGEDEFFAGMTFDMGGLDRNEMDEGGRRWMDGNTALQDRTYTFEDDHLQLEEQGVLVAGRMTTCYSGMSWNDPFRVWIDDETRLALKYEVFNRDGTLGYMMEVVSLTLGSEAFPALAELPGLLPTRAWAGERSVEELWADYAASLGVQLTRGGGGWDAQDWSEWPWDEGEDGDWGDGWDDEPAVARGTLLVAADTPEGFAIVQHWSEPPTGDLVIPSEVAGQAVIGIDDEALLNCDITSLTIPEGVTRVGIDAFLGCNSLTDARLPESLTIIPKGMFFVCGALTEVELPNTVTRINEYAFAGCERLTRMTVPEGVTVIEMCAFAWNGLLTSVTLPASAIDIADDVFEGCDQLTLTVPAGSYAEAYAQRLGIAYITIEE